jgi:hypothetical protein
MLIWPIIYNGHMMIMSLKKTLESEGLKECPVV